MSYNSGSNRARNFKSAERKALGRFEITRPITPWIVLHSVQLLLLITSAEVIIAGGQIFKITASRFVNVSEEDINLMKENAIPRNTKHTTKFGMTHFKGKMWKFVLNVTKKWFKFPWKCCLCQHAWINQWFHNKSWLLWWPVSLSIRIQSTLNHIQFVFYHNIKDN